MSLEPTEEQRAAIEKAAEDAYETCSAGHDCGGFDPLVLWPIIRDMVLEEAAKAIESDPTIGECDGQCAEAIRALKGKP